MGIHLGRDGYKHREVRDRLREDDINWNLPFTLNIRKARSSLVYSDYVYRKFHLYRLTVAKVNVFKSAFRVC